MAQTSEIREHMEVRDSVGMHVGTVDHVEGDRIKLTRSNSPDGVHHNVPLSAVSRVDSHVHLNQTAAALGVPVAGAAATGATTGGTAGGGEHPLPPVLNRAVEGAQPRGNFYLPWIVGLVGLLLLLLLFKSCVTDKRDDTVAGAPATTMAGTGKIAGDTGVVAATSGAPAAAPLGVSGLGAYLGGTAPVPVTFVFEKINFDTAKSDIRPQDQDEVDQVAGVLKQYGQARIRIAGYADARGSDPANARLGQARADAVKAALVAQGIAAGRIETATGGEGDPVDTNATAGGQAENRRTELVVVGR